MKKKKPVPFAPIGGHKNTGACPLCGCVPEGGLQVVFSGRFAGSVCSDCADRLWKEFNDEQDDLDDADAIAWARGLER
jgi:hypothetical protein